MSKRKVPISKVRSYAGWVSRQATAKQHANGHDVEMLAGLQRALKRMGEQYLRVLGLVALVVDYEKALLLLEILQNLPATRRDGTPWRKEALECARALASELHRSKVDNPSLWDTYPHEPLWPESESSAHEGAPDAARKSPLRPRPNPKAT